MSAHRVNVRTLAEFAHEHGDLMPLLQAAARMQEGARVHRLRQAGYEVGFEREVSLSMSVTVAGAQLTVYGRADGVCESADPPIVEEIKTTRLEPDSIELSDFPEHFEQAAIYAHLLAHQRGYERVEVRLVYLHPSGAEKTHARTMTRDELARRFFACATPYADWLAALDDRRAESVPQMRALTFPYEQYRDGQRAMAAAVYRAIRDRQRAMIEAPTGIGKTMAVLFAAVKALGEGIAPRAFYLTARTTTRVAAERALALMRARGARIHAITLTAKEKICPTPGGVCDPATCPRALGYFDRRRDALIEGLAIEALDRAGVEALAAQYELCPFELQLDLSETADVVICDYNYAFDPRVKLRRFFLEKNASCLLVDEAHNLIERGRDMLSAAVRQQDFSRLRREIAPLADARLTEALAELIEAFKGLREVHPAQDADTDKPETLLEALDIFCDAAQPYLGAGAKRLTDRFFEAQNFLRVAGDMGASHRVLYDPGEKSFEVKLWCWSPAEYLARCYQRVGGVALFSATLSPARYFADMLGLTEDDALIDLPSPFPPEHQLTLRLPLKTTYRTRAESVSQVAAAILSLCRAKVGNYIACFPSHAYLALLREALIASAGDVRVVAQTPQMSEAERDAFLARFHTRLDASMLALIVMGGVFAEGIDLPGELLSGAAIVGVGIPQISLERAVFAEIMEERGEAGDGARYAYVYPGMQRVLQASGRVIRTADDRGVILLIDERFFGEEYDALLPPHWQPRSLRHVEDLSARLDKFWRKK